ncbi:phosphatidate cytidylyltransferase [Pseudomonas sp. RAC1]|uniref:phosphatidate cytidylyltransferase n=1 Tax=Pseudomonas sp. RAC1 TaxID=3064900 RepID=UPI002723A0E6|nr:phosphatidate cytidylyltransferase [Pseudomonas sp. RAC1]MDV9032746.1 phosphatidate cytidylyltransferase [Pseudomonas sp. RAC1]
MLKQRIITALILLPVALGGFFLLGGADFALFIGFVVTVGAWEWARLAGLTAQPLRLAYATVVAGALMLLYLMPDLAPWVLGASVIWWGLATWLVLTYPRSSELWGSAACRLLIGLLVLLPAWQGLVLLKHWPLGNGLILSVMVLVWAADIGAYFSGRAFGKRKLAPQVSPGKSWEGVYGGMAVSLLITLVVGLVRDWGIGQILLGLVGALIVVMSSVVGDLTESMFKRREGIKDSSNLLPGHGGVLDRIDSLTAAIPMFAVLLWAAEWGVM